MNDQATYSKLAKMVISDNTSGRPAGWGNKISCRRCGEMYPWHGHAACPACIRKQAIANRDVSHPHGIVAESTREKRDAVARYAERELQAGRAKTMSEAVHLAYRPLPAYFE